MLLHIKKKKKCILRDETENLFKQFLFFLYWKIFILFKVNSLCSFQFQNQKSHFPWIFFFRQYQISFNFKRIKSFRCDVKSSRRFKNKKNKISYKTEVLEQNCPWFVSGLFKIEAKCTAFFLSKINIFFNLKYL